MVKTTGLIKITQPPKGKVQGSLVALGQLPTRLQEMLMKIFQKITSVIGEPSLDAQEATKGSTVQEIFSRKTSFIDNFTANKFHIY